MPIIKPISDLRNNFAAISETCHREGEPVFITRNGEGDLVVMSMAAYEQREADLVVLNDAGPIIGMQALKSGIRLFARKNEYEEFFVRTLNEFDDLKRLRAPIEEAVPRRRIYA